LIDGKVVREEEERRGKEEERNRGYLYGGLASEVA
jgi:hypothetical protein